ncbi:MAG: hypothetical protein KDC46_12200 [Thermoleophilia bacterium]|nr:hypothetical protein [Thermoleophilia bacterium]
MKSRLPVVVVLLLVASVLLVACGGGPSKDDYESGLRTVQAHLDKANEASQGAAGSTDKALRSKALDDAHKEIVAAADAAADLDPPSDVKDAHADLVKALRDYADLFGRLAKLDESDPAAAELYGEAGDIVDRLDKANRALEKAGYSVGDDKAKS